MSSASSELQATLDKAQHAQSLHETSKALQLYQHALELLHAQIQAAAPASQQQQQLISLFKDVLTRAEDLKQAGPASQKPKQWLQAPQTPAAVSTSSGAPTAASASAGGPAAAQQSQAAAGAAQSAPAATAVAEYQQCKERARELAVQAVGADGSGQAAVALQLYSSLLEVLNRCHRLEGSTAVQAQIMARFQVRNVEHMSRQIQNGWLSSRCNCQRTLLWHRPLACP